MENYQRAKRLMFWLELQEPFREQLMEYGKVMVRNKHIILYLRCQIYRKDILEQDRGDLEGFLNILYKGFLLLDTLEIKFGLPVWSFQPLFGPTFDVSKDFVLQAVTKKNFLRETVDEIDHAENFFHLQNRLIADFKFQQVKPKLPSLIMRFETHLKVVDKEERDGVEDCLNVLYYLKNFIE